MVGVAQFCGWWFQRIFMFLKGLKLCLIHIFLQDPEMAFYRYSLKGDGSKKYLNKHYTNKLMAYCQYFFLNRQKKTLYNFLFCTQLCLTLCCCITSDNFQEYIEVSVCYMTKCEYFLLDWTLYIKLSSTMIWVKSVLTCLLFSIQSVFIFYFMFSYKWRNVQTKRQ